MNTQAQTNDETAEGSPGTGHKIDSGTEGSPPLSPKTLALAAQLEERRKNEVLIQTSAMMLGAALIKLGGGTRIALTQADFDAMLANSSVEVLPLEPGEIMSIRLNPRSTYAKASEVSHGG